MGKKGSWFSAIKRVFTHNSKEKPINGEKKKGKGILRRGETKSFNIFREPSSIEKILGEADQLLIRPPTAPENWRKEPSFLERPSSSRIASSPKAASPRVSSSRVLSPKPHSPRAVSPKPEAPRPNDPPRAYDLRASSSKTAAPPKVTQERKEISYVQRPEPTLRNQHVSATKIQAAYRGYKARRSFRALKGLVRLQGVVRGQNVKRQTANAMKQMQLLVRVQTQIQSRRIQMLDRQYKNDKEAESTLSKWTQLSEAGNNEDWDDSLLTKEEVEARLRRKVEAVIKRDRAVSYAYSQQLRKFNPKSARTPLDSRSNGYPWWWNWLERQMPPTTTSQSQTASKNIALTPPRPISEYKPSPRLHANNYNHKHFPFDNHNEVLTPRSSRSSIPIRAKQFQSPNRTPQPENKTRFVKYSRPRGSAANSARDVSLKDDDSLMSCPPFSVPNYRTPTVSAKAKERAYSNPKERFPVTLGSDSKRRFSFPLTPIWNKGSNKDVTSPRVSEKRGYPRSIGERSVDSAVSMPALLGRKPFNRFV